MTATSGGSYGGGSYGGGRYYQVIFYDGEQESNIGNILVSKETDFRAFQTRLSSKIGISQNQFTTFLKHQNQPSRKIPITPIINFSTILQDSKYYFLVSLKRSNSRDKKIKPFKPNNNSSLFMSSPNVMLLRRGEESVNGFYDMVVEDFHAERRRVFSSFSNIRIGREEKGSSDVVKDDPVCEECLKGDDAVGEFHCCVRDPVVSQPFRSPFGPIARPVEKR